MSEDITTRIAVWSDYVCPFCYLELPVLDRLEAAFGRRIEIDWLAFELRPEPAPTLEPDGDYLQRVWSQSVYPMATERGMTLRLPPAQPRSRKAFEAAEFARGAGRFDVMHRALFRAFFEDGRDLGDIEVLLDVGGANGLDRTQLRQALETGRHMPKVLADQQLARELGVSGVPALVISTDDRAYLVSGAQPYEALRDLIEQVVGARELAS